MSLTLLSFFYTFYASVKLLSYYESLLKFFCMEEKDICTKVCEIVAEHLRIDVSEVTLLSDLRDDLGADSLDVVEIVMKLEKEFHIYISDAENDSIQCVRDLCDLCQKES